MVEGKTKLKNPVGLVGGILVIISAFLHWIEIPILGGANPLDITRIITAISGYGGTDGAMASIIFVAILLLVLGGGIIAIFKARIGGGVAIAEIILFTIILIALQLELSKSSRSYGFPAPSIFSLIGAGYYLAWAGALIAVFSNKIKRGIIVE